MNFNFSDFSPQAESIDPITLTPSGSSKAGIDWGNVWGEAKDLAKFYTAAKLAPGSLTSAPVTPQTPTTPEASKGIADVLQPIAAVYAADQAIKRTNANPPYMIYTLLGFGVLTLYIVLNRKKG